MSETTTERARASAPTLHDVARAARVSPATASRVLNGSTPKVAGAYRDVGSLALRATVVQEWDVDVLPLPLEVVLRDSTPRRSG